MRKAKEKVSSAKQQRKLRKKGRLKCGLYFGKGNSLVTFERAISVER